MGAHLSQHAHVPTAESEHFHVFVCSAKTACSSYLNQTVVPLKTKDACQAFFHVRVDLSLRLFGLRTHSCVWVRVRAVGI